MNFNKNWDSITFEDLFEIPLRNGVSKPKRVRGNGIKMVNMKEIFAFDIIGNQYMEKAPLSDNEMANCLLKNGDLLFARQSLTLEGAGKCSIINNIKDDLTFESHLIRVRLKKELANPMFYYYFFTSPYGKELLMSITEQVAAAGIRGSDLKKLKVPYPSLNEQNIISKILFSIDEKLIINKELNEKLEETSNLIFTEWFENYNFPDTEGLPYVTSGGEMQDSDLGMIPHDWNITTLSEFVNISNKSVSPSKFLDTMFEHYSIPAYDAEKFPVYELGKEIKSNKYKVDKDSILISKLNPTKKRIWRPLVLTKTAVCSTEFINFKPKYEEYRDFCFCIIDSKKFSDYLVSNATGSTNSRQRVSPSSTLNFKIVRPDDNTIKQFIKVVKPMYERAQENYKENDRLMKLRNTLRTRIISGEISVTNKE